MFWLGALRKRPGEIVSHIWELLVSVTEVHEKR